MTKDNLISLADRTTEEQREIAKKGGIASVRSRRKKKLMREQLELLLSLPLKNEKVQQKLTELGIYKKDMDNQMSLIASIYVKSLSGDIQAATFIRDTLGEKAVEVLEIRKPVEEVAKEIEDYINEKEK